MGIWESRLSGAAGTINAVSDLRVAGADIRALGRTFALVQPGGRLPEQQFYVIWRQRSAGFFSIVSSILGHLRIAEGLGATPALDMRTFPNRYTDTNDKTGSGWDCYFRPFTSHSLESIHAAARVLVVDGSHPPDTTMFVSEDQQLREIWSRRIRLADEASHFVEAALEAAELGPATLAVHARVGDMRTAKGHPLPPTLNQLRHLVRHALDAHGFERVLVCSDDAQIVGEFSNWFGSRVFAMTYPSARPTVLPGMRVLADATAMSRAAGMVVGTSNVSEASFLMREQDPRFSVRVWNGWNSNRPVVPRFHWYCRSLLPSAFGGFSAVACPVCDPGNQASRRVPEWQPGSPQ